MKQWPGYGWGAVKLAQMRMLYQTWSTPEIFQTPSEKSSRQDSSRLLPTFPLRSHYVSLLSVIRPVSALESPTRTAAFWAALPGGWFPPVPDRIVRPFGTVGGGRVALLSSQNTAAHIRNRNHSRSSRQWPGKAETRQAASPFLSSALQLSHCHGPLISVPLTTSTLSPAWRYLLPLDDSGLMLPAVLFTVKVWHGISSPDRSWE